MATVVIATIYIFSQKNNSIMSDVNLELPKLYNEAADFMPINGTAR